MSCSHIFWLQHGCIPTIPPSQLLSVRACRPDWKGQSTKNKGLKKPSRNAQLQVWEEKEQERSLFTIGSQSIPCCPVLWLVQVCSLKLLLHPFYTWPQIGSQHFHSGSRAPQKFIYCGWPWNRSWTTKWQVRSQPKDWELLPLLLYLRSDGKLSWTTMEFMCATAHTNAFNTRPLVLPVAIKGNHCTIRQTNRSSSTSVSIWNLPSHLYKTSNSKDSYTKNLFYWTC